jgi:ABC-type transport system involved in multi-copper enzyme maturation permease subunit
VSAPTAAAGEPLHARVAGFLERAFNPILVKELRGSLRGNRFFAAHLTVLGLFATGLLATLGLSLEAAANLQTPDPSAIGQKVFFVTQALQLGVVLLVVPGLAATSVTGERESLTHDLLLTTGLEARQIVWGKFSAAMVQAFTLLVSLLPLVGLCFLFGGVTLPQIAAGYAVLFALSALSVAFALFVSANSSSTQRAVGTVYVTALLAAVAAGFAWTQAEHSPTLRSLLHAAGAPELQSSRAEEPKAAEFALYGVALPLYAWSALLVLFFLGAANRLKPSFANRSTNLRIYAIVASLLAAALISACYRHEFGGESSVRERSEALAAFAVGLLPLVLLLSMFACEDPLPADPRGVGRRIPWVLRPGAGTGAAFTVLLAGSLLAGSFVEFVPLMDGFSRGAWAGLPRLFPVALAFAAVLAWAAFCASLARLLACAWPDRPLLVRSVLVAVAVFLAAAPLVHWGVAQEFRRSDFDRQGLHGPWSLALSPAAAVLAALDLSQYRRDFPLLCAGVPIPAAWSGFALAATAAFVGVGSRLRRRATAKSAPPAPPETV